VIDIDSSSMVILLLITFLAWSINIPWLFVGLLILFVLTSGSVAVSAVTLIGVGLLTILKQEQYWFVLLFIIIGLALMLQSRKKEAKGEEYYSPELMQLLGGVE